MVYLIISQSLYLDKRLIAGCLYNLIEYEVFNDSCKNNQKVNKHNFLSILKDITFEVLS